MSWQCNFNLKIAKAYKWIIMFCNNGEMTDDLDFEWLFDVEHGEQGKCILQWQPITMLSFFSLYFTSMGCFSPRGKDRSVLGKVKEVHQKN